MSYVEISLGEQVGLARRNKGLTQKRLGSLVGLSVTSVTRIETDKRIIAPEVIVAISRALACPQLLRSYCDKCPVAVERGIARP